MSRASRGLPERRESGGCPGLHRHGGRSQRRRTAKAALFCFAMQSRAITPGGGKECRRSRCRPGQSPLRLAPLGRPKARLSN